MRSPLFKRNSTDVFSSEKVQNDLGEFTFDYLFSGWRQGEVIELFVATWVIDVDDNLFIRECHYRGHSEGWKEVIQGQLKNLMADIDISAGLIKSSMRFFEVDNEHHRQPEKYEKEYLELKAKATRE